MNPVRIVAPVATVVSLADLRLQLDADPNDTTQDGMIQDIAAECVAMLDGYRGELQRAIMPQTWREDFDGWGDLRLMLPDVQSVVVTYFDGTDYIAAPSAVLKYDRRGSYVETDGPDAESIRVDYVVQMPDDILPSVQAAVKLYTRFRYDHRGGADPQALAAFQRAFQAQISHARARRL